jgi:hypothetical protein
VRQSRFETPYRTLIDYCVNRSRHCGDFYAKSIGFLYNLDDRRAERFRLTDRQSAWLNRIEKEFRDE